MIGRRKKKTGETTHDLIENVKAVEWKSSNRTCQNRYRQNKMDRDNHECP